MKGSNEFSNNFLIRRNESYHRFQQKEGARHSLTRSRSGSISGGENSALLGPAGQDGKRSVVVPTYSSSSLTGLALQQPTGQNNTIRFQVIVWYIGSLNVIEGRVPVTFRVTMFWNDTSSLPALRSFDNDTESMDSGKSTRSLRWEMKGRQTAVPKEINSDDVAAVAVPSVSILNVVTFSTIGEPEIALLREDVGLWRWTCMYRADLIQDHWRVDDFPHDRHDICLKLAVLAHRRPGQQWDRNIWKLSLATEGDSQGNIRVPYGLIVDPIRIPEFSQASEEGLRFEFESLRNHGPGGGYIGSSEEQCLTVKLSVQRDSYYYDRNVVPLLGALNLVAITVTALDPDEFFQRALLILNIAFVEISIRMTTDKHLPSVAYQIKLQRLLNEYFFGLLFLVLISNLVFEMDRFGYTTFTVWVDLFAASIVCSHNVLTLFRYYAGVRQKRPTKRS